MRVFLTGATGFIGARVVPELIAAGHGVLGLTRSDAGARTLAAAGAEAHRGTLEDPDSLAAGAAAADAVIHCAFDHRFAHFVENCAKDARVIRAMGAAIRGTDKPLIVTSGTAMGSPGAGEPAREEVFDRANPNPRVQSELTGEELLADGVSFAAVRLPQVHDPVKQGLVSPLVDLARQAGVSAYVGEGANRWPAAHVSDVARLFALALAHHRPGARWHAVAEEGVAVRAIAEALGKGLGVPVEPRAPAHFGWLAHFAEVDMPASSARTRAELKWEPTGPDLLSDLAAMDYRAA